jgi:signal transduction histidine kinase
VAVRTRLTTRLVLAFGSLVAVPALLTVALVERRLDAVVRALPVAVALGVLGSWLFARRFGRLVEEFRVRHRALEAEHERLERHLRELHRLHEVGRELGVASHTEGVLRLVADAARKLSGARQAEAVAQVDGRDRPWWSAPAAAPFTIEVRERVEAALESRLAIPRSARPDGLPAALEAIPVAHGIDLFGWILIGGAPPRSRETDEVLAILAGQAATTLRNLELIEQRLRSERLGTIGRMISTIVHDFRNPMTAVRGYAAMLEEIDIDPARRKQCARLVVEETDRMSTMIDEILEFTRGGPAHLRRRAVSVGEISARLRRLIEPDMKARRIAFSEDLAYTGSVAVDIDRLLRAMVNIASNALDAMEPGGTLLLRSRGLDSEVEIDLADSGKGIPEDLVDRIYDPFFTHGKAHGIGLGMSITRKIVEEHGGKIRLTSAVGKGTCVTLSLPAPPVPA